MIQILGLRSYFNENGVEDEKLEFFQRRWQAPSVIDLIENYEAYLEKIPTAERYNIYFTQFQNTSKRHSFKESYVIPFDIDGIDVSLLPEMASESQAEMKGLKASINPYLEVVCKTLGLNVYETGAIFTGHGLHLIVALKDPITSPLFYKGIRPHYNAVCAKVTQALEAANLPGYAECPGLFSTGVTGFRMPGTENRKPDKPPVLTRLLQRKIVPVDFDLKALSGLPDVALEDQFTPNRNFKVDTEAVLAGCDFLKFAKAEPNSVSEAQWYAMLSITGRCENGTQLSHEYSQGYAGYNYDQTELKLNQALEASKPRTCKNINQLWGKCQGCPNFEKVGSPISLKGEGYIDTQDSGFHTTYVDDKGNLKVGKPVYEDLRKFYERKVRYKVMGESGICYTWTGTHYQIMGDLYLKSFAQTNFIPESSKKMRDEFKDLVCCTNLVPPQWFVDTTQKRINFKNGVLDLRTGDLEPHNKEYGFRYVLPYDYDASATCPTFENYLDQVLSKDEELKKVLLEYAGYSFSGDRCWTDQVLVLIGPGGNGKSVFLDVLKELAGDNNFSDLDWKDIRNPTMRAMMDGKLFNLMEESPSDALLKSAFFKNIVTGGGMSINMKYKNPYTIRNKTKLMFSCNEMPESSDHTEGFFRRLLIVPFKVVFNEKLGNVDRELRPKLFKELSGIFNLVLGGYQRLNKQKRFTKSQETENQLEAYKLDVDHATRWIKENVHAFPLNGGEKWAVIPEMYQAYRNEMMSSGERPVTHINFGKKLSQIIPEYPNRLRQKKLHGKNNRVLIDCSYSCDPEA